MGISVCSEKSRTEETQERVDTSNVDILTKTEARAEKLPVSNKGLSQAVVLHCQGKGRHKHSRQDGLEFFRSIRKITK